MERLPWLMQVGPKCNLTDPYKREIERNLTVHKRGEGHVVETEESKVREK